MTFKVLSAYFYQRNASGGYIRVIGYSRSYSFGYSGSTLLDSRSPTELQSKTKLKKTINKKST